MATKELEQIWNNAVAVAIVETTIGVAILEQQQRKFHMRYLEYCYLKFPNMEDTHPRLLFALIFNYKMSTHHKERGAVTQREKPQ